MKRKRVTAKELNDRLLADPEWVAAEAERDRKFAELQAAYDRAEAPMKKDLSDVGVVVKSVWDLVNTKSPYPAAVPILLAHLNRPYPERIREGIARALAVREARIGWDTLLKAFREETDKTTVGVKWALALALGATATDAELDEVIPLLRDQSLGRNRAPLLSILVRSNDSRADALLEELGHEKELAQDVAAFQRRRNARRQRKQKTDSDKPT